MLFLQKYAKADLEPHAAVHPPSQETTAVKPWRNAKRVPSDPSAKASGRRAEALAKEGCFGGFRRSPNMRHGSEAVALHSVTHIRSVSQERNRCKTMTFLGNCSGTSTADAAFPEARRQAMCLAC